MPWPELTEAEQDLREYFASIKIRIITDSKTKKRFIAFSLETLKEAIELRQKLITEYELIEENLVVEKNTLLRINPDAFNIVANNIGLKCNDLQTPPYISFKFEKPSREIIRQTDEIIGYLKEHGQDFYKLMQLFFIANDEGIQLRDWYKLNRDSYNIDVYLGDKNLLPARAATRFTYLLQDLLAITMIPESAFFKEYFAPNAKNPKSNILLICLSQIYAESIDLTNIKLLFQHNPKFLEAFSEDNIDTFSEMYHDYNDYLKRKSCTSYSSQSTLSCHTEELDSSPEVEEPPLAKKKASETIYHYTFRKRKKDEKSTDDTKKEEKEEKYLSNKKLRK